MKTVYPELPSRDINSWRKYISEDQIKYSNKHLESIESLIETIQLVQANLYKDISGKGYATILADAITKYRLLNSK